MINKEKLIESQWNVETFQYEEDIDIEHNKVVRRDVAVKILSGILSNGKMDKKQAVRRSVEIADLLIEELEK